MRCFRSPTFGAIAALSAATAGATAANAVRIPFVISSSATDASAGPGALNPGTLTGSFTYNTNNSNFLNVSFDIEGVQSTDLNGSYGLFAGKDSTSTDLYIRGLTAVNAGGQSNQNTFLDIRFATALGTGSDAIASITSFNGGNPAKFSTPPTAAFAVPLPEPASWSLMLAGFGLVGFAMRRRRPAVIFA